MAKFLTKLITATGITCVAAGAAMYEIALNMDVNSIFQKLTNKSDDAPDDQPVWNNNALIEEAGKWAEQFYPEDTAMYSARIERNTFAKIIRNDSCSDKWAVIVHGFSADPGAMSHYAKTYWENGYNVLLPYMTGHGPDTVRHSSMGYYDKMIVLDWIEQIVRENPEAKIVIHGVSMGAATTMLVTGELIPDNVKVAVSDCGYSSVWEEYQVQIRQMFHLPEFPILQTANLISKATENFDFKKCSPMQAVIKSKTPTLFIHGEKDDFVPYNMMEPLFEACSAPDKDMLSIPDAGHACSVFWHPDLYWNKVWEFIKKHI